MARLLAAQRYARALHSFALGLGRADAVREELDAVGRVLEASPELAAFVAHPAVPARSQEAVMQKVLAERVGMEVLRLVRLLCRRRRLALLPAVCAIFGRLHNDHLGIRRATIASPHPLRADQLAAIAERMRAEYGCAIEVREERDPSLLAGFTVRVGDTVHDLSARGKLERLRRALAG